jgi:hypothetical protein
MPNNDDCCYGLGGAAAIAGALGCLLACLIHPMAPAHSGGTTRAVAASDLSVRESANRSDA